MKKRWVIKEKSKEIPNLPEYPVFILNLLANRGINTEQKIKEYLETDYSKLHDPFLFKDMKHAVERIKAAVKNQEKITIYADYDADAITAASVVYLGLKKLGITAECYIPDRFSEGYGMNLDAIKTIAENGTKLIITVDCGINAVEEAALSKSLGIDLIITDHHELTAVLPDAFAIINPKNPEDNYPYQYLTGVGVAFKLMQALLPDGYEKWLLDLVAIGTVADCQSLSGENRILVSFGLKVLPKTKWVGLKELLASSALKDNKYDAFTLGFVLGPRINAAGRIQHGQTAFKLLVSESSEEAKSLATELNQLNSKRQLLTEQVLSEAKAQIELRLDKKVLLAVGKDWPKGVVGLVAGRLAEEYNRPVLAISEHEGVGVGSARSSSDFDLIAALKSAHSFFIKYGGHKQAAGFTVENGKIELLYENLLKHADSLEYQVSDPVLELDAEITPQEINWDNYGYLEKFAPFGIDNPKPRFAGRGLDVLDMRIVGNGNKHVKLRIGYGEHMLDAICFSMSYLMNTLRIGQKIDAAFELISNEWNGTKQLQLKILDIKPHESR